MDFWVDLSIVAIAVLVVGMILYAYKQIMGVVINKKPLKQEIRQEETDLDKLKKIAEDRIKFAESKEIDKLVFDSYFEIVCHCPYWIKQKKDNRHIKDIISYAKEGKTSKGDEFTEIILNEKRFKFVYKKNVSYSFLPDDKTDYNCLDLFYKNKKVFSVEVNVYHYNDDNPFSVSEKGLGLVEAFVDGDRIDDLRMLKLASEKDSEEKSVKWKEISEKEEAKKLKKNFGI